MKPIIKWRWTIASGLLLLGLMIGSHWLYGQYAVEKPLMQELSQKIPITHWEMKKIQGKERIVLGLGSVENLGQAMGDVRNSLRASGGQYLLRVQDQATPELESLWQNIHLLVYEGLNKGNYAELDGKVREIAANSGVQSQISVDGEFLYVQLQKGDGYLYRMLPLQKSTAPAGWIMVNGEVSSLD